VQPPVSPTQVEMEGEIHGAARWREAGFGIARFVRGNLRGSTLDEAISRPPLVLGEDAALHSALTLGLGVLRDAAATPLVTRPDGC
jgi:hypothetical protein